MCFKIFTYLNARCAFCIFFQKVTVNVRPLNMDGHIDQSPASGMNVVDDLYVCVFLT